MRLRVFWCVPLSHDVMGGSDTLRGAAGRPGKGAKCIFLGVNMCFFVFFCPRHRLWGGWKERGGLYIERELTQRHGGSTWGLLGGGLGSL